MLHYLIPFDDWERFGGRFAYLPRQGLIDGRVHIHKDYDEQLEWMTDLAIDDSSWKDYLKNNERIVGDQK